MSTTTPPELHEPAAPPARQWRWFGWWFYVVVLVIAPFALILTAAVTVWLYWQLGDMRAAGEVRAEVARIQARGEPVTLYDLDQYHRVPEGKKDITATWVAAFALYDGTQYFADCQPLPIVGTGSELELMAAVPNSQLAAAEAFLVKHDAVVQATLAAGREEGECRLPTIFHLGGTAGGSPHLMQSRSLGRLMSLRVRVSVVRGNLDTAIESIEASLAAARALENQLTVAEYMCRRDLIRRALVDIEFLLNRAELTDEQLDRLERNVNSFDTHQSLTTALLGERGVAYRQRFHSPSPLAMPPPSPTATAADPMAGSELIRPADCLFFLEIIEQQIAASRQPLRQAVETTNQIHERTFPYKDARAIPEIVRFQQSFKLLPLGSAPIYGRARLEARRELMLAAIAAKRYRMAHGEYPATWELLTPEFLPSVPSDPIDGQPLRLVVEKEGLLLYSVGADGVDDGGQDPQEIDHPDIVVRLRGGASGAKSRP
jgi:hypothetical protein